MSPLSNDTVSIACGEKELLFYAPDSKDHIQKSIRTAGRLYEEDMLLDILGRDLGPGVIIDVGANIGNHTVFFAKVLERRVFALEPYDKAFHVLQANITLNDVESTVVLLPKAAGRLASRAELKTPPHGNWGQAGIGVNDSGPIEVVRLDQLNLSERVALIKIDVEGMELDVLDGARGLLERDRPILYVEAQSGAQYANVKRWLRAFDYQMIRRFSYTPTFAFVSCRTPEEHDAVLLEKMEALALLDDLAIGHRQMSRAFSHREPALRKAVSTTVRNVLDEKCAALEVGMRSAAAESTAQVLEQVQEIRSVTADGAAQLESVVQSAKQQLSAELIQQHNNNQHAIQLVYDVVEQAKTRLSQEFSKSLSETVAQIWAAQSSALASQSDALLQALQRALQPSSNCSLASPDDSDLHSDRAAETKLLRILNEYFDQRIRRFAGDSVSDQRVARNARDARTPSVASSEVMLALPFEKARVVIRLPNQLGQRAFVDAPATRSAAAPAPNGTVTGGLPSSHSAAEATEWNGAHSNTVSVIMTTYNSAQYVRQSILSILEQTYSDLELIIVDDASTDDTFEILAEVAKTDSRVRPFKMFVNRGTYWCKNYGMTRSTGRYLTFQDSDDISDADRLRLQLQELRNTQAVMCTCNYVRIDEAGDVVPNRGRTERKAIMAPLIDKDEIVRRAGYFDSVRTSADDEFNRRIGIVFGQSRICHIDQPLYKATVRDGSLTNDPRTKADISITDDDGSDRSFLSAPRREYVRQYAAWHEKLKKGTEDPRIHFPQLRRRFPAPARLLVERVHQDSYVTASMASIPVREELLRQTVDSILHQIDVLNVYLNGYDRTPAFLEHPRIHVAHSREYGDLRDNGKFFFLDSLLPGYHFTIDDDILYPSDYVQKHILKIEQYEREAVVGCHGVNLANPMVTFMDGRKVFHFAKRQDSDRIVNLLGTGTVAYHTGTIELVLDDFRAPGMADLWLAVAAKRQNVPLISVERPAAWLKPLLEDDESSLYRAAKTDCGLQTEVAQAEGPWGLDELCTGNRLMQNLLRRFSQEEIRCGGLDCDGLLRTPQIDRGELLQYETSTNIS